MYFYVTIYLFIPSPDRKNGKILITGIGSYFYPEPRGVTDTPGYSAAVSAIGGSKYLALEGKKYHFRTPKKLEIVFFRSGDPTGGFQAFPSDHI